VHNPLRLDSALQLCPQLLSVLPLCADKSFGKNKINIKNENINLNIVFSPTIQVNTCIRQGQFMLFYFGDPMATFLG
jgi:hypothetical protein